MLTRRSMLGILGLAPFAAKALASAKPEPTPPPVILPPKGPTPRELAATCCFWPMGNVYRADQDLTDFGDCSRWKDSE